jgi:hypothetical protein
MTAAQEPRERRAHGLARRGTRQRAFERVGHAREGGDDDDHATLPLRPPAPKDYDNLAPFARNDETMDQSAKQTSNVMCLTCHRAHATGFPEMLRWNMEGEFMVYNSLYPGTDTTPTVPQFARGRLGVETQAAYYDRPVTQFASYKRVLCNKCHARD